MYWVFVIIYFGGVVRAVELAEVDEHVSGKRFFFLGVKCFFKLSVYVAWSHWAA